MNTQSHSLLLPSEAAEHLRVEQSTLAAWRSAGSPSLPYVKLGNAVRYRPTDLEEFIESRLQSRKGR